MAACTPIPVLNLICDAVGAVIEAGYQGIAAFEGAKAAVETISAVTAQRKEQAELVMAVENQEEAARLAVESEQFQVKADEESGKAAFEESDSEATKVDAGEAQLLGDEKIEQSEEEEALAAFDVEVRKSCCIWMYTSWALLLIRFTFPSYLESIRAVCQSSPR